MPDYDGAAGRDRVFRHFSHLLDERPRSVADVCDAALAASVVLLTAAEPRQGAMALLVLCTGLDLETACDMAWHAIDDATGCARVYDRKLGDVRAVPLPRVVALAIRGLPYDGRDWVFAASPEEAWPMPVVADFDDGPSVEIGVDAFRGGFLRTAGALGRLQCVIDETAPPACSSGWGRLNRFSSTVEAVSGHYVPLIAAARRANELPRLSGTRS